MGVLSVSLSSAAVAGVSASHAITIIIIIVAAVPDISEPMDPSSTSASVITRLGFFGVRGHPPPTQLVLHERLLCVLEQQPRARRARPSLCNNRVLEVHVHISQH